MDSTRSQEEEEELEDSQQDFHSLRAEVGLEEDSVDSLLPIPTISLLVCSEVWEEWEEWVEWEEEEEGEVRGGKLLQTEILSHRWEVVEEDSLEDSVVWEWISTMTICKVEDQLRRNLLQKSVSRKFSFFS